MNATGCGALVDTTDELPKRSTERFDRSYSEL